MGTRRAQERAPAPGRHPAAINGTEGPTEEEPEGPGVRADSRNYLLSVRPENRTTFCAIISQLTEETQPCFEATLKSRAVSEDGDAKFTCIVSGFPEPELTWYKDDEEMDRYCGLPKYEILRNGKRHTLQLYKCREEDAAIYQASARNCKGIVSCSGVLEVGTMTEYKIHQRWFAKLKRKAEAKMREIEQSRKRGKENVLDKLRTLSPERIQRKRRFSADDGKKSLTLMDNEDMIKVHIPDATSRLNSGVANLVEQQLMNGGSNFPDEVSLRPTTEEMTSNGFASQENLEEDGKKFLAYVCETVEIITKRPAKESSAKKKKKEEESAAIPLELNREDKAITSGMQKSPESSPVAVRTRCATMPSKNKAHETMEVEKSAAMQINRNNLTVSPKIPKMGFSREPKKIKDAETLKSKEPEGCNTQLCSAPSKEEGYFSLREMYLENTISPLEEKKMPQIPERIRTKTKADNQGLKIAKEKPPESSHPFTSRSGPECPKVILRYDPGQKEATTRRQPQADDTTGGNLKEMGITSKFLDSKNMELKRHSQVPNLVPKIQHSPPVEKGLFCKKTGPPSTPSPKAPGAGFGESDHLDFVLPNVEPVCEILAASISPKDVQQDLPPSKKYEFKNPPPDPHREQLIFESPSEVMAREEALQKYHYLEMEYQALQQAYALLQQQLERTLKSDKEVEDMDTNATSTVTGTSTLKLGVSNEEPTSPLTESKSTVSEPIKVQTPPSELDLSAHVMVKSKDPAALPKTVPESSEPKPPARKTKGHTSESKGSAPAVKSPALVLNAFEPVLKAVAPEKNEPVPPARKTKAPAPEPSIAALVLKDTATEQNESKVPLLELKFLDSEPSVTSPAPEPTTLLSQSSASELKTPAAEPKMLAPKPNKDTENNKINVNAIDAPVFMETDIYEEDSSGHTSKPAVLPALNVGCSASEQLLAKSKMLLAHSCDTQYTPEVNGPLKAKDTVEIDIRNKDSSLSAEAMGEDTAQKTDAQRFPLKECITGHSGETFSETVVFPSEVEMVEDTKQDQQTSGTVTGTSESWVGTHNPCSKIEPSSIENKSLSNSHEVIDKVLGVMEDASKIVSGIISSCTEEVIRPTVTDAGISVSSQSHHHPTDLPPAKMPISSSTSEESVANLLRDVKKELERSNSSDMASSTKEDTGNVLLRKGKLSPEEDLEVEIRLQVSQREVKDEKQVELSSMDQAIEENVFKMEMLSPVSPETKGPTNIVVRVPLVSHSTPEVDLETITMDPEKQNSGFVASLKNSLLMLLNITKTDTDKHKRNSKDDVKVVKEDKEDTFTNNDISTDMGGVKAMNEPGKHDTYIQNEECLTSSSTSGIMTPMSDEDMVQNAEVLQQSPTLDRKCAEVIDKELFSNMDISSTSPKTATNGMANKELFSSKEDLHLSLSTIKGQRGKVASETEGMSLSLPSIVVASEPLVVSANEVPSDTSLDENGKSKSEDNISMIPAATAQELALGARRKIYLAKSKLLDDAESNAIDSITVPDNTKRDSPTVSPGLSRRNPSLLQTSTSSQSPPVERRSPGVARKMTTLEVPKMYEESTEKTTSESTLPKEKDSFAEIKEESVEPKKDNDPFKAPQVIRKIRAEQFSDASGNLKLWCQFFNILSDSTILWFKDDYPVAEANRGSGDEGQVALAIVQASKNDSGVYQCTIQNKYGTDSTDFLLSAEALSGFIVREETEVGEEIEMTPMVFAKGLADSGYWGDKFFGRILAEDVNVGKGYRRKVLRVKVIYGLEPLFESGKTCIIKVRNLITFGTKNESTLIEKNYDLTIQGCKIQNTAREYCKIFAAEARVVPNFGQIPEIIPLNLIYRPANNIPYATIEEDLEGQFEKYCTKDKNGNLQMKNTTEIEKKCCSFQHWAYQWTNGNFLITDLQGVGWKITNVAIATKTKGYQGLKESCCTASLDLFTSVHMCNNYCEMLGLRSLKSTDMLQTPAKPKGSKSPSTGRKAGSAQSSPQVTKKAMSSPQGTRKSAISPKTARKSAETGEPPSSVRHKTVEMSKPVRMR